jgi:hypothetical protein
MVAVTQFYGYVGAKRNLSVDEEFAEMEHFRAAKEEPWPMVFGGRSNSDAYGVGGIPHWVVLDREGNIAFMHIGYSPEIFKPFREKVKNLVEGKG